ncbi:hypothetical protein Tco_0875903 [Tanacetum coccineum]|uniref:Uncharacterized protein n=1 Tax=Tanacetum coccineum TaxID=301880 RepID=A0ABQ5BTI8_9ASTR
MVELTYKLRMRDMVEMVTGMQGDKTRIRHLMQEMGIMKAIRLFCVFHELCQIRERQIEQMLLAMKDEAESNLNDEENDFMLDNSFRDETLEELTAAAISEVNASHKMISKRVHEHKNHGKCKTVINTSDDDQIDSNIIFDDPYVQNNGGSDKHDSSNHDQYHDVKILAYNALREADNQKRLNNKLKKQKMLLEQELDMCKERVKTFESKTIQCTKYKETCDELEREIHVDKDTIERILKEQDKIESEFFKVENEKLIIQHETRLAKKAFKEREDQYLENITPNQVYDPFLKAGMGYENPEHLKKAIAAQPKMYHGEKLYSTKLKINSPDSEETLEDMEES